MITTRMGQFCFPTVRCKYSRALKTNPFQHLEKVQRTWMKQSGARQACNKSVWKSHTHRVPKNTDKIGWNTARGNTKGLLARKTAKCERQVEDKNTTDHTPLDPFLQSQYFVTRPTTAPKQKLHSKAKQAPKRYRATSSSHELMKCTHTSHSPSVGNKWKKET